MFFCDRCALDSDWPNSLFKSIGKCEICGSKAECNDIPSSRLPKKESLFCETTGWAKYSWEDKKSHPPKPGRYIIHRKGCGKTHFEKWNGSGWSTSNSDCTHWRFLPINPID